MAVLIFLFGALLALGLFFIAADFLKLPRLATQRAMLSVGRQEKKQARSMEALLMGWAVKLAPHIHMDEYKRSRLKNTLNLPVPCTPARLCSPAGNYPMHTGTAPVGACDSVSGYCRLFQGDQAGG